ncbi:MAG: site-specific integrase [Gemmatimonadetes bacterium]|nr:site-specific integrase [Gemmatimonadota bacterium]MDA1103957.1 site-specific integrase [Gemmatimonadota bacterium]
MPRTGTGRIYRRSIFVDVDGSPCKKSDPGAVARELPTWWIDYSFRGKRYRESSESEKKKDATDLLRKRMAEVGSGTLIGPTEEKVTFEDLADMIETDYTVNGRRSGGRLKTSLTHLRGVFGTSRAIDITSDRVNRYIAARQKEGAANASIQKELAALKRAFNLAVQARRLSTRPYIPGVKVDNARQGFFEWAELEKVVAELPEALRPVVRFAALTGWRKAECLSLQWSQVDFKAGEVRLWTSKNDEGRSFPFRSLPPLEALLEEQRERTRALERDAGEIITHVFHRHHRTKEGRVAWVRPIRTFQKAWDEACDRAGLTGWLFHDLRRTAVRGLERAGVPRSVAMKLTGHKTEAVYRRYAIADAKSLEEGVEKLARLHASDATKRSKVVRMRKSARQGLLAPGH